MGARGISIFILREGLINKYNRNSSPSDRNNLYCVLFFFHAQRNNCCFFISIIPIFIFSFIYLLQVFKKILVCLSNQIL
jgi:hypothetical protein